jgi:serine/threonine protein kinase
MYHQEVFVQFYGWFENGDTIFLAMEYFQYGDLQGCITQGLTEDDAKVITTQLLEGLRILHESGFTHRDLKPQVRSVTSVSGLWRMTNIY